MFIPSLYTFKSLSGPFVSSFPFNFYCFLSQPLSSDNLSSIRVPTDPLVSSSCYCPFSFTFSRRRFHHRSHFVVRFISSSFASLSLSLSPSFSLFLSVSVFLSLLMSFPISRFVAAAPPSISSHENVRYCHRGETSNQRGRLASEEFSSFFEARSGSRIDENRSVFRFRRNHKTVYTPVHRC